ncbi:glycoside hydrolase family 16 protein [Gonapodya prolifera JEL478]|uniref:Glycoside hydrolase family 16 protein n=1 Tax=Gonapodya prolifera (strain JEL478) TaxID=1344416 RepID=A0A139AUR9_GONPJ|nr:glycoside hydrolase family 16 protein [Gonapodya prolifera JEL478]|eukprot:KXS20472.1 glycoside hydrolase family 16 protein [Gonapodya prolifera JEL478]
MRHTLPASLVAGAVLLAGVDAACSDLWGQCGGAEQLVLTVHSLGIILNCEPVPCLASSRSRSHPTQTNAFFASLPAPQPQLQQSCVAQYNQCGGEGFVGPKTCCDQGWSCVYVNTKYSQCNWQSRSCDTIYNDYTTGKTLSTQDFSDWRIWSCSKWYPQGVGSTALAQAASAPVASTSQRTCDTIYAAVQAGTPASAQDQSDWKLWKCKNWFPKGIGATRTATPAAASATASASNSTASRTPAAQGATVPAPPPPPPPPPAPARTCDSIYAAVKGGATASAQDLTDWSTWSCNTWHPDGIGGGAAAQGAVTPQPAPPPAAASDSYIAGWKLVWSDEFNGNSLDQGTWSIYTGAVHNNEAQTYSTAGENVYVANGNLVLQAVNKGGWWTSGKVQTQGKRTFQFGRIDVRAKVPTGSGTWPAIWLLGAFSNAWPYQGEIDMLEYAGNKGPYCYSTLHTQARNWQYGNQLTNNVWIDQNAFNTYSLVWTSSEVIVSVNGQTVLDGRQADFGWDVTAWPFSQNFYLILNLAMGGDFGQHIGAQGNQQFLIDFVRYYQRA